MRVPTKEMKESHIVFVYNSLVGVVLRPAVGCSKPEPEALEEQPEYSVIDLAAHMRGTKNLSLARDYQRMQVTLITAGEGAIHNLVRTPTI